MNSSTQSQNHNRILTICIIALLLAVALPAAAAANSHRPPPVPDNIDEEIPPPPPPPSAGNTGTTSPHGHTYSPRRAATVAPGSPRPHLVAIVAPTPRPRTTRPLRSSNFTSLWLPIASSSTPQPRPSSLEWKMVCSTTSSAATADTRIGLWIPPFAELKAKYPSGDEVSPLQWLQPPHRQARQNRLPASRKQNSRRHLLRRPRARQKQSLHLPLRPRTRHHLRRLVT